jgi:Zn-dependent peptidase ImmA (M78 family)
MSPPYARSPWQTPDGWPETEARRLARATGGDVDALAERLGVLVGRAPGRDGLCAYVEGGPVVVLLPRDDRERALHELGHAALHVGYADALERGGSPCWRRQWMKEEAQADRFADAFDREE